MNIDRSQIVDLLRSRGENDKAAEAERDLPVAVDTDHGRPRRADRALRGHERAEGARA